MFLTIDTPLISSAIYSDQWPATYSEETILVHACLHLGGPSHFTGVGKGGGGEQIPAFMESPFPEFPTRVST